MLRNFFKKKKTATSQENETNPSASQVNETNKDFDRYVLSKAGYSLFQGTIGEGTFSKVKRAYSKFHDKDVAIKVINRECAPNDFLDRFLPRELKLILGLKHANICHYYDIIEKNNKVYIAMEYASNGDVLEYILKNKYIEEVAARKIFKQILAGVKYLHTKHILHRDLKCENILLSSNNQAIITDFGFAKKITDIKCLNQTYCGSSAYAPIEILNGMPYDGCAADVWSIGCILFIMTTGTMPYDDTNKNAQIVSMRKGATFTRSKQKLSLECHVAIRMILNPDVAKRATIETIEESKWCKMMSYKLGNIYQPPRFLGDMGEPSDSGVEIVTDRYSASSIEQEATTEKKARHSTDN